MCFCERLRAAMLAAGIVSITELSEKTGIQAQVIAGWLDSCGDSMLAKDFPPLRAVLEVRLMWLLQGAGTMAPAGVQDIELVQISSELRPRHLVRWKTMGRALARIR